MLAVPIAIKAGVHALPTGGGVFLYQAAAVALRYIRSSEAAIDQTRASPPVRPARQAWDMDAEIPADSVFEIMRLQSHAEVVTDDLGALPTSDGKRGFDQVHLRGGRATGTAFMIDGMQVTNLTFGGLAVPVAPVGVAEMIVMEGGLSPEFGNALDGVVNLITRDSRSQRQLEGSAEVASSEMTGDPRDDFRDLTRFEGFLGGPLIGPDKVSFHLSGLSSTRRDYLVEKDAIVFDPTWTNVIMDPDELLQQIGSDGLPIWAGDLMSGWIGYGFHNEWTGMLNTTWKVTPAMRLSVTGLLSGSRRAPFDPGFRYSQQWGIPKDVQDAWTFGLTYPGGISPQVPRFTEPASSISGTRPTSWRWPTSGSRPSGPTS